jgi:Cdc6-like AAA superfamily ATPase
VVDERDNNLNWMMKEPDSKTVNNEEEFWELVKELDNNYRVVMSATEHYLERGEIAFPALVCWNEGQIYIS